MFTTINMNLTVWDLATDPYSHNQLTQNWETIDTHDHSPGNGVQIGTASILPNSITQGLLAPNSVGVNELQDGSVTADKFAGGFGVPLGGCVPWYRQGSEPIDSQFAFCDGRPWSSIPNDLGYSSGNIPDLRSAFIMGIDLSGVAGSTGGSNQLNLTHSHVVNSHSHSVNAHFHGISNDAGHTHSISTDGDHGHGWLGNVLQQRQTGTSGGNRATLFVPGLAGDPVNAPMDNAGAHSHGGFVSGVGPHNHGGTTSSGSATTDSQAPNTSNGLGLTDIRPSWVGLIWIMRVKTS